MLTIVLRSDPTFKSLRKVKIGMKSVAVLEGEVMEGES